MIDRTGIEFFGCLRRHLENDASCQGSGLDG